MNIRSKTTWGLDLAAVTLSLTADCGSEVAPPANDIGGVDNTTADVRPEQGTARLQNDDAEGAGRTSDRSTARLQFADNGY